MCHGGARRVIPGNPKTISVHAACAAKQADCGGARRRGEALDADGLPTTANFGGATAGHLFARPVTGWGGVLRVRSAC